MDKDNLSLIVSSLSAFAAIISTIIAIVTIRMAVASIRRQGRTQGLLLSYDLQSRLFEMMRQDPALLEILGIDINELKKDGVRPEEFIFIDASLSTSHALYRINEQNRIELSSARRSFLKNVKVRTVWEKYLRNKLFGETTWAEAIDAHIAKCEAADKKAS